MDQVISSNIQSKTLLLSCAFVLLGGCGFIEAAKYTPGKTDKVKEETKVGAPLTPPLEPEPEQSSERFRALTFDTGISPCVGTEFSDNNQWIFKPIEHSKSLQDFINVNTIGSLAEFIVGLDLILREIVDPVEGLVDYSRIREGGPYSDVWMRLRNALASVPLNTLQSENEKTAFWVNTYNFLMIDILRDNPEALNSRQRSATFSRSKHTVSGNSITLDQIEYGVLRLGGRSLQHPFPAAAPEKVDSRLHVALVCGAKGCPKLRNFAYEPEKLDVILNENVHMFINDKQKHVAYDPQSQTVRVSELFQWFSVDFDSFAGGARPSDVKRFILKGCRNDKDQLTNFFDSIDTFSKLSREQKIPYDWTSNELTLN